MIREIKDSVAELVIWQKHLTTPHQEMSDEEYEVVVAGGCRCDYCKAWIKEKGYED